MKPSLVLIDQLHAKSHDKSDRVLFLGPLPCVFLLCYDGGMATGGAGLSRQQWDELLDGQTREVDLTHLDLPGGPVTFRSAAYREAAKRYGKVSVQWINTFTMRVKGQDCRPALRARIDSQGGRPNAYPQRPGNLPAPQDQPPSTVEPSEDEAEALLGPCTCGQDPRCLPSCERFS